MRVLGVDPGLTRCGLGVVDGSVGGVLRAVAVGVVRTPADADLGARLLVIGQTIDAWLDEHQPDAVAVERVFSQHNVRTVMGTAQVSGVAIVAASMVMRLLRLAERPTPPDAADALALAMCHIWRGGAESRIRAAQAAAAGGSR